MATDNQRLPEKNELLVADAQDKIHIVDVSDVSAHPSGTSKWIKAENLGGGGANPTDFLSLTDVLESSYVGQDGKVVVVAAGGGLEFTDQTPAQFLGLTDVNETTYEGKENQVPAVTVDYSTDPATSSLKFRRFPTFEDLYGGNAIINGGVVLRSTTALMYNVWSTSFVINNRYYNINVSDDVTLTQGDTTFGRIDVLAIEIDSSEPPNASVVVLEGVPSASPVKPTVDLSNQVEVSFVNVAANQFIDPNAVTDTIYDDNTGEPNEWDNVLTPTGANLNDSTDPKVGTVAMSFPVYTATDVLSFKKDTMITFVPDESLIFYIKPDVRFPLKSSLNFKLINSATLGYWSISLSTTNLQNYGFDLDSFGTWQLIQIPLSELIANSRNEIEYDTLELTFSKTSALSLDWMVIQGDVANPSTGTLEGYNESGTQAGRNLLIKIGDLLGTFIEIDEINSKAVLNMTAEEIDAQSDERNITNKDYISKISAQGYTETGSSITNDLKVVIGDEARQRIEIEPNGDINLFKNDVGIISSNMSTAEIEAASNNALVTKEYLSTKESGIKTVKKTITASEIEDSLFVGNPSTPVPINIVPPIDADTAIDVVSVYAKIIPDSVDGYDDISMGFFNYDVAPGGAGGASSIQFGLYRVFTSGLPLGVPFMEKGYINSTISPTDGRTYYNFGQGLNLFAFNWNGLGTADIDLIVNYREITF